MTVGITELPPEGMQLGGVALAGDAERGTKTTEGLSLLFTTAGITVQGPQPQIERLLVWSGLDSASCREKIDLPDGRNAAVMELTSGGQSIRFLLPMDAVTPGQAAYLDQALPAWLARYKGSVAPGAPAPRSPAPPPPAPAHASTLSNGGSTSSGSQRTGEGSRNDVIAPAGIGAPAAAAQGLTPAEAAAAAGAAAAAAAGAAAAASANGTTGGPSDPGAGSAPPAFGSPGAFSPADPGSATRPDLSGSSFVARSNTGSVPPSGGVPATAPPAPGPPPPPAAPAGGAPVGTAGWDLSSGAASGAGSSVSTPAELSSEVRDPARKPKGWRKNRPGEAPDPGSELPTSDFFAPSRPPAEPPADPVPLALAGSLPPPADAGLAPPGTRGPIAWRPPIDPLTGEPAWDQSPAPADSPPKERRSWHRGAKASAVTAAGAASAAAVAGTAGPEVAAPGRPAPPGPGFKLPTPLAEPPAPKSNRTLLAVLLVVLLVVIGGIAYFAVKNNSNSTPTTVATGPVSPRVSADAALAASINLHLGDLPSGWSRSPSTVRSLVPVAPAAAQIQAAHGLSSCLSQPYALVAGLFGNAAVPGSSAKVSSPTFQSGTDSGIQMASTTTVMTTVAGNQVLAAPFANPNFTSCFGNYQTALVSAASPGSSASVQTVTLPVPAGVTTFAYLTTFTSPGGRTEVEGEAFSFGGRSGSRLMPMTDGPAVPQSAFASAYDAVTGRLALAVNK
ncbi:MAG: hypothetical protein ABSC41_03585 [Acidimicrobiales bacterium]